MYVTDALIAKCNQHIHTAIENYPRSFGEDAVMVRLFFKNVYLNAFFKTVS